MTVTRQRTLIWAVIASVIAFFGFLLMQEAGGSKFIISSAALSPRATKIAMSVWPRSGGTKRVLIYDLSADTFRLLPPIETGWSPNSPAFSSDERLLAVAAQCVDACTDPNDVSRIVVADVETGNWETVASGAGYREEPAFLPGDQRLLYAHGPATKRRDGQYAPLTQEPTIGDIKSGKEYALSFGEIWFFAILSPQVGPDSSVFFTGIWPEDKILQQKIQGLGKMNPDTASLLYRLKVEGLYDQPKSIGRPELVDRINAIPGPENLGQFQFSADRHRLIFRTSEDLPGPGLQEVIYSVDNGSARRVLATQINIRNLKLSADGRTALILGDQSRSGRAAGLWDFFLLDVDSGSVKPLPLLHRLDGAMKRAAESR